VIRLEVENDGSGDVAVASYNVSVSLPHPEGGYGIYEAKVEEFQRGRGWAELVREAVTALEKAGVR
jgi:hypothetical protein